MERESCFNEELKKEYEKPELKKLDIKDTENGGGGGFDGSTIGIS